jgi:hypothetical protein
MLIDEFMSDYDVVERHEINISASAGQVYAAVRALDLSGSAIIRSLFWLLGILPRQVMPKLPGISCSPRKLMAEHDSLQRQEFIVWTMPAGGFFGVIGFSSSRSVVGFVKRRYGPSSARQRTQ